MGSTRPLWLLLSSLVSSACAPSLAPLQVPPSLLGRADRYPVSGHVGLLRHTLSFGPYVARRTRVGVQHPSLQKPTLYNDMTERADNHQSASFELLAPDKVLLRAECQKHQHSVRKLESTVALDQTTPKPAAEGRFVTASETYRCTLIRPESSPMQLFIVQGSSGLVQADDVELSFLPVRPGADQPAPTWKTSAGFLIADATHELAAVDLTAAPAVTLRRDLTPRKRAELAAVCIALLLLRDMF